MRNLNSAVDSSNLVDSLDLGAQTTVDAEHLAVNDSTNREIVEDLGAVFPRIRVTVFSVDLVVKSINCSDLSA